MSPESIKDGLNSDDLDQVEQGLLALLALVDAAGADADLSFLDLDPFAQAWIAGCIRDPIQGDSPFGPTDKICSACVTQSAPSVEVAWDCSQDTPLPSGAARLGVKTHSVCRKVGLRADSTRAYWTGAIPLASFNASVCCK